jgi:hypothetical protein
MVIPHDHSENVAPSERAENNPEEAKPRHSGPAGCSRRSFIGTIGIGSAAAVALAAVPLEPLIEGKHGEAEASVIPYRSNNRANDSFNYRKSTAQNEKIDVGELPDNGDLGRFSDYSGSWSKVLPHTALGIVNPTAYQSFLHALTTGRFSDFEHIIVGNPGGGAPTSAFNGPQGGLAFDLEGLDCAATVIPPAPSITSAQSAAELVEHYWGALMRDVHFSDYATSSMAAQACEDMNNMSYFRSTQNIECPFPVTPQNLFRGQFYVGDGNVQGPYLSQFFVQPTTLGVQALTQQFQRFLSVSEGGADFMTTPAEYLSVESGGIPTGTLQFDPTARYLRMGRDLAAYTHVDVLYQEFFVAMLVLSSINCPANPGNPYVGSRTEHGFGTFGGPDIAGTMAEMATRALKASWFHKWIVNLRPRPEEMAALVHANLTNQNPMPQAAQQLSRDVLNSAVLPLIHSQYSSYLLPQAFPEGAPGHPCYPTGHGTVAGACITALKFFFDGNQRIQPLLQAAGRDVFVPSSDGLSLEPYTGSDAGGLTVNGELSKLAFNTSFGHGIHSGIHFRSSTQYSILLGEQVALSILQDRARSYNEPFTIEITKFDGTTATISNQH